MAFWPNDTLKDVAVVMEGYGTVEVKFTPSDGGVGTRMQVTSQSKYQGGTAGASAAARAAPDAPAASGTHAPLAVDQPHANAPAGTHAPIDIDQPPTPAPAGTHTPIDVDQPTTPAAAGMHVPIAVEPAATLAPASTRAPIVAQQHGHSESESPEGTPSQDGTDADGSRNRTPSDYGDYAADGMLLVRESQVQLMPMDGAPGYFRMMDPRFMELLQDPDAGAESASSIAEAQPAHPEPRAQRKSRKTRKPNTKH
ncbi:hypothetical protein FA95DRAFT_1612910 [Auriscalpium vulgare]|uniref:Uncharacterized protein n=1 Tax=Auriscalpium vulgare TaxID=40419 RepID=A0ACB8R5D2_9AGAM|nr:hypothetical protein FA95DRAFT_1612910 [Auriscalpium vulgare]